MYRLSSTTVSSGQQIELTEYPGFLVIEGRLFNYSWAMRTEDFVAQVEKEGGTDFLFDPYSVSYAQRYYGVTDKYLKNYVNSPQITYFDGEILDVRDLAESGRFGNIVYDGSVDDGYIYNLNGEPLIRSFYVELDCAIHPLRSTKKALIENKKARNVRAKGVKRGSIFQDHSGELTFNYFPDPDEFSELFKADKADPLIGAEEYILDKLAIKKG